MPSKAWIGIPDAVIQHCVLVALGGHDGDVIEGVNEFAPPVLRCLNFADCEVADVFSRDLAQPSISPLHRLQGGYAGPPVFGGEEVASNNEGEVVQL